MSQKTHPIGFRLGITPKITSNISSEHVTTSKRIRKAYSLKDLHGLTSRWATSNNGGIHNYSNYAQRDLQIKSLIQELLEEDGYITNKIIVTRNASYVGVYVDAYELDEPRHNFQVPRGNKLDITKLDLQLGNEPIRKVSSTKLIEGYISEYIEHGKPVHIQFVKLDTNVIGQVNDSSNKTNDLAKIVQRISQDHIPCCNLLAKVLALKRSQGGRQEREAIRRVTKLRQTSKDDQYGLKGYLLRFKGRIGGSERSRIIRYRSGPLPRHTVSAAIDYGFSEVNSASGKVSVTVLTYFKLT